jgi:hypothetical protein
MATSQREVWRDNRQAVYDAVVAAAGGINMVAHHDGAHQGEHLERVPPDCGSLRDAS